MVLGIGKAIKYVPVSIACSCILVSPELILEVNRHGAVNFQL